MPLARATDGRVAGHDPCSHCSKGRLRSGMSSADDYHSEIPMFHVKHSLFPDAEARKYLIQQVFHVNTTNQRFHGANGNPQFLGRKFCTTWTMY